MNVNQLDELNELKGLIGLNRLKGLKGLKGLTAFARQCASRFNHCNYSGVIDARPHPGPLPRGEGASFAALGGSGVVRRIDRPMRILLTRQQREQGSFQDAPTRSPSPRGRGPG